jgi:hypothetical protein
MSEGDRDASTTSVPPLHGGWVPPDAVLNKLRNFRLFKDLSPDEFREVMTLLRAKRVDEGDLLIQQGGTDTNLYVLRKGKALIRAAEKGGKDPVISSVEPGGVINELPFTTGRPDESTVEAATNLLLWYIGRDEFRGLLAAHDSIAGKLKFSPEALAFQAERRRFTEQRPGERVLWFSHRWWWSLVKGQVLTIFLVLLIVVFLTVPALQSFAVTPLGTFILTLLGIAALLVCLWNLYDYWNDYFVITDQRVIHRERVLLIYDQQDESPMGKIQNVTVTRPSFLSTLFDVGNVMIETQGSRANVEFTEVSRPGVPNKIILDEQSRVKVEGRASERSKVRAELRQEMRVAHPPEEQPKEKAEKKRLPLHQRLGARLVNARNNVLPRMRLTRGNEIVWRKHWLYLLQRAALPAIACVVYAGFLLYARIFLPELSEVLFGTALRWVVLLLGFLLLFWLVWQYEDWRNDLYILTPDRLIDYKRSPFGLLGTQQKTANLSAVQNVTATTLGFIDTLFNMGDVAIRTGGVENELLYSRVYNPRMVQSEIVKALEEYQTRQLDQEAARRRREFIEWIGIYDELTRIHTGRTPLA